MNMKAAKTPNGGGMPELLSERHAARYIAMSAVFLRKARRYGRGPRNVRIAEKTIRYRVSDLKEWIDSQLVG